MSCVHVFVYRTSQHKGLEILSKMQAAVHSIKAVAPGTLVLRTYLIDDTGE
jgi:hypothetical protein